MQTFAPPEPRHSDTPPLTRLLCRLRHGLCSLRRVGHLVGYGLGYAVLLARAGVLTGRVVGHLDLNGVVGKEKENMMTKHKPKESLSQTDTVTLQQYRVLT